MRILHIIDSLGIGGAERLLVGIINNLPDDEHHMLTLSENTELFHELPVDCRMTRLPFKSKKDTLRCVRITRSYIQKNKIDVVHSHLVLSNIIARLATPRHIKLFNSLHNLNGKKIFGSGLSWKRILEKSTYRKWHHLIAVSGEVLDDYKKNIGIKGPATVLYNFVDDRFFASHPRHRTSVEQLRLIAVGSFKTQKNYEFLVEALRGLSPAIQLDIYGDGHLRESIEKKISEYGSNIRLCGIRSDIHKIIPEYDLYVMSSLYEGHPIAMLEAMACGLPTLVSDIPVLREASGGYGLFFSLGSTGEFVDMINKIQAQQIDLDSYAAHNLSYANQVGRKDNYLRKLKELYLGISN